MITNEGNSNHGSGGIMSQFSKFELKGNSNLSMAKFLSSNLTDS